MSELTTLHDDGVLELTISRDGAGNSLDHDAVLAGADALHRVMRGQLDARAVLLTGQGKNFCAGGNVAKFAAADDRRAYLRGLAHDLNTFVSALYATQRPTVAAATGWAAGAGMSLALHADFAIGGPSTRMRPAYPGIGLSPDGGMSWLLPQIVGLGRARTILLRDEVLDAPALLEASLLSEIVDDDQVRTRARAVAAELAAGPTGSYAAIRRLLLASSSHTLDEQLIAEAESIADLSITGEGVEGVDAFLAKRIPDFPRARG
ncbi:putative enoyl-CoA hydratase [Gordonia hirsuta DSM 44140 = NBRC 16056]|uniref:Putative enoyl-CoA hydratase n=1 Tax=Gordonia hirsuta DSM 44140 = NBRC 16056 TaxID=1121927 RepID=L7L8Z3_9ACTN|nr:enoyl-CoA hydratase-related protein [Gordonia hirsuta]GAC57231.1 putative enoyl-CoA hydratase [Gordonia hirsuta DSM 44140 = NBRC 16056]